MTIISKVPPDGGYGWVIVFAVALSNIIIIPLLQNFGLIFKDTFNAMGLSATEGALIINLNASFGMILGVLNGLLLKIFGYRKVSLLASTLLFVGIVATSFAVTFAQFIIAYGIITSLGIGLILSANTLALNSYFTKQRSRATSYTMTLTGLGPILMPQLINYLMTVHTVNGVTFILGAISAHTFIASTLLQPVEKHMIVTRNEEQVPLQDKSETQKRQEFSTLLENDEEVEIEVKNPAVWGMDSDYGSVISIPSSVAMRRASVVSQNRAKNCTNPQGNNEPIDNTELTTPLKKQENSIYQTIVRLFDLDLMKDPIYLNMMLGMSLAVFAELSFAVLIAFILADFGLTNEQIAMFLSTQGIVDVIFRFLAPYIADYFQKPARSMYLVTLFLLMTTRFMMLISTNYIVLLGVAVACGVARGLRIVYMNLLIPSYVPIEKFASASGMQMMVNGIFILVGGPIIGLVRDVTGSYSWCIVILNGVTVTTVVMWTVEFMIVRLRNKNQNDTQNDQ